LNNPKEKKRFREHFWNNPKGRVAHFDDLTDSPILCLSIESDQQKLYFCIILVIHLQSGR
jgi:hypothetical protein